MIAAPDHLRTNGMGKMSTAAADLPLDTETRRFESDDINACRSFLRAEGLECGPGPKPWRSDTMLGGIYFAESRWHAACWPHARSAYELKLEKEGA